MSRGKPATKVALTARQRSLLTKQRNKASVAVQQRDRIDIILGAFSGKSNLSLCQQLGVCRSTATHWRKRWAACYEGLYSYEAGVAGRGVSDRDLLARMLTVLEDAPRSGAPVRISMAQKQQITALACRKPRHYGIPVTQWNREMLAQVAMAQGIVETISPRYISRLLKNKPVTTS